MNTRTALLRDIAARRCLINRHGVHVSHLHAADINPR